LALDRERIGVVPFGVDTEYYDAATMREPGGGSGLIAVGGDRRRDYSTLVEAVRISDVPLTLVCYPRNIAGLDRPPHIKVLFGISHDEYRRLLHSADLVVTPTVAPAYPSGQSVVLEAMSMGKATLTTDSSAMRDYITDGVNGVLVPPRAPAVMAELIRALLTDGNHRHSIGLAAAETVRERFGLEQMWKCVSKLMTVACTSQSGSPR
jgi:glycosyltransferase involved in cell wall biosynthesis